MDKLVTLYISLEVEDPSMLNVPEVCNALQTFGFAEVFDITVEEIEGEEEKEDVKEVVKEREWAEQDFADETP